MRICIIGAGNLGLGIAYHLSKKGHDIFLIEKSKEIGGVSSTFKIRWSGKDYVFPKNYRFIGKSKENIKIISELEIKKPEFDPYGKGTTFWIRNKKVKIDFLRIIANTDLSLNRKIKILIRSSGFNFGAKPIGMGILKNYKKFYQKLEGKLSQKGVQFKKNCVIQSIDFKGKKLKYSKNNKQEELKFDAIVSTIPPKILASYDTYKKIPKHILKKTAKIDYRDFVSVILGIDTELNLPTFNFFLDEKFGFSEVINFSRPLKLPRGKSLVYATIYNQKSVELPDKEIKKRMIKRLGKISPEIKTKASWIEVFRSTTCRNSSIFESLPQANELDHFEKNFFIYQQAKNGIFEIAKKIIGDNRYSLRQKIENKSHFGLFPRECRKFSEKISRIVND